MALNYYKSPERIGNRDNDFLNPPTWLRSLMEIINGWIDSRFHLFIPKENVFQFTMCIYSKRSLGIIIVKSWNWRFNTKKIELLFIKSEFVIFLNYKLLCIYSERLLEIVIVKNWNWKFNIKKLSYYLSRICYFFELYFSVLFFCITNYCVFIQRYYWKKIYY